MGIFRIAIFIDALYFLVHFFHKQFCVDEADYNLDDGGTWGGKRQIEN